MIFSHHDKGNTENLNIYYNTKLLVLKALNCCQTQYEAAHQLGISERTLLTYKKVFRIQKDPVTGMYGASPVLPASLKKDILQHLRKVPSKTIWGVAISRFSEEAATKTDHDFSALLQQIKSQMNDCPDVMETILGDSYSFFQMINA